MKKVVFALLTIAVLSFGWGFVRFSAMFEGYGLEPIATRGNTTEFINSIRSTINQQYQGNYVAAVIENGETVAQEFSSKGRPVNENTVFGVASVSKWVTALGVMKLVEQGVVSLDEPVENYLTRWSLPPSEFDNRQVTLRRLLSHTAGIEDGLGHNGFAPGEKVQPLVEHLTQALDADEGVSGKVIVTKQPGSEWVYSGGSYNLVQLIIEDVTGQSFEQFMQEQIFNPLEMKSTSYQVDRGSADTAQYFAANQIERAYPYYTSLAATGLYTSLSDMQRLVKAILASSWRPSDVPRLLNNASLREMRHPHADVQGMDIWGLGTMLFAETPNGHIIGHGGKSPYLNATVRFDPFDGSAFIMFQTGNDEALASDMATLWTVWKTGKPDMYMIANQMGNAVIDTLIGSVVITIVVLTCIIMYSRKRRKSRRF